MASSKATEWGWFFLRAGAGLIFLELGINGLHASHTDLRAVAQLVAGASALVGLLVRPCALALIVAMAWLSVTMKSVSVHLAYHALAPILLAIGLLVGGGGTVLALGACVNGLRSRWWQ